MCNDGGRTCLHSGRNTQSFSHTKQAHIKSTTFEGRKLLNKKERPAMDSHSEDYCATKKVDPFATNSYVALLASMSFKHLLSRSLAS